MCVCVCVRSCIFVALKSVQFLCFFRTHRFALAIIAIAYASARAPAPASCPPFNPITIFVLFIMLHRVRPSAFSPLSPLFSPLSVLHLCKFWLLKLKLIIWQLSLANDLGRHTADSHCTCLSPSPSACCHLAHLLSWLCVRPRSTVINEERRQCVLFFFTYFKLSPSLSPSLSPALATLTLILVCFFKCPTNVFSVRRHSLVRYT